MRTATTHGGQPSLLNPIPFLPLLLLLLRPASATSYITVFTDHSCQTSYTDWDGPNGYPDGACTLFSDKAGGAYSSFMINSLDAGCTATIYAPNTTPNPCSGTPVLASPYRCYNASDWTYYSIDRCTPPDQLSSSTSPSSAQTAEPTAAASSSPPGGASSSSSSSTTVIGAAVGGGVGGVALVGGVGLWLWMARRRRRRGGEGGGRRRREGGGAEGPATVEISGAPILEMEGEGRRELAGSEVVAAGRGEGKEDEGGRRAPVELPADEGWAAGRRGGEKGGEGG
ncbi:hypothetical protein GTA08_BOTSDO06721 [Neofusicoccum parvum]|uniref:Uncharacterized protein n=1 Tax=Neofusicoccum parvum TaxID=310453 RepID=A0ACB5RNA3_9PEZI|nr:hypothetical protein GTA08_BOTSDO06721 [Neofusicoccum parvum]